MTACVRLSASIALEVVAFAIILYTAFSNLDLTSLRLLVDYWPRYVLACAILAVAVELGEWRR